MTAIEKPTYLYYFGDHDPSGLEIERQIKRRLSEFGADVHFERVAVTPEQIEEWDLPIRPTKKTDARAAAFAGGSVEVDSITPDRLRMLVQDCITQHVDEKSLEVTRVAEESEKDILGKLMDLHP